MIQPIGTRLLVKPLLNEEVSSGGIYVEEDLEFLTSVKCEVIAIGSSVHGFEPGDIVFAIKQAFTATKEDPADTTVIIDVEDVLAVIVPDPAS